MRDMDSAASSEKASNYLQQAIEKDPNYANAYAKLANLYGTWIPGMTEGPRQRMPKAKEFALRALSLDNALADAHSYLGMVELFYDWDWAASEQQYAQAIAIEPSSLELCAWHARALVTSGHPDEAVSEAEKILALSYSPMEWDYPLWIFILAHRYDLARARGTELLEVAPAWVWGHYEMAQIYEQQGDWDKGAAEFLKTDEMFGTDPKTLSQLKDAFSKSGFRGYWRRKLAIFEESARSQYVPPDVVAEACVRLGDKECTFKWLEKGFQERDDLMINLKVEPLFDNLHSDAYFQDLIRRVGIP